MNMRIPVVASLAAVAAIAAAPAGALARPDTRAMTCQQAQNFVRASGAVVMTTGQFTYERIVTNRGYCDRDETTRIKVAPTRDDMQCRVGYRCAPTFREPFIFMTH